MTSRSHKVLFLHGLDSSKESTKFEAIDTAHKLCINVDYRNLNFKTVEKFGGVLKSMLTLNEAIIDVKEG